MKLRGGRGGMTSYKPGLVGGFDPIEKYSSNLIISPGRDTFPIGFW